MAGQGPTSVAPPSFVKHKFLRFDVHPEMMSEWSGGPNARGWGSGHRRAETGGGRPEAVGATGHRSPAPGRRQSSVTVAFRQAGVVGHPKGQVFSSPNHPYVAKR